MQDCGGVGAESLAAICIKTRSASAQRCGIRLPIPHRLDSSALPKSSLCLQSWLTLRAFNLVEGWKHYFPSKAQCKIVRLWMSFGLSVRSQSISSMGLASSDILVEFVWAKQPHVPNQFKCYYIINLWWHEQNQNRWFDDLTDLNRNDGDLHVARGRWVKTEWMRSMFWWVLTNQFALQSPSQNSTSLCYMLVLYVVPNNYIPEPWHVWRLLPFTLLVMKVKIAPIIWT